MRRLGVLFPSLLVLLALSEARADIAGPGFWPRRPPVRPPIAPPAPQPKAPRVDKMALVIEIDNRARIPRLQIPKKLLAGAAAPGAAPGAQGSAAGSAEPRQNADVGPRRLPTLIAGVALALGFASAGLWLVRRRGRRTLATVGILLGLVILGGAALWANAPPPFPPPEPPTPPQPAPPQPAPPANLAQLVLPAGILLPGNINVEVVDKGEAIKLIVNKNMVLRAGGVRPPQPPGNAASDEE